MILKKQVNDIRLNAIIKAEDLQTNDLVLYEGIERLVRKVLTSEDESRIVVVLFLAGSSEGQSLHSLRVNPFYHMGYSNFY